MTTILDFSGLVGGDDSADLRCLPVIVSGDQRPIAVMQLQLDLLVDLGGHVDSRRRVGDGGKIISIHLSIVESIAGTTETP